MLGLFKPRTTDIPDALWSATVGELRLLDARTPDAIAQLRALCERFLATKAITPAQDFPLDDRARLIVAALACLPALKFGIDALAGWHEVIVYPGQFRVRRHHRDDDSAVVTEWDDELAGESWSHGPVILSWADVEQDLAEPFEGFNVVIHEIAHKLDMRDGEADGIPPMPGAQRRAFAKVMAQAYGEFCAEVEAGRETAMDPYAAEAEDEFFAVASEYYFSAPDVLAGHYPDVHRVLKDFYGDVPFPAVAAPG